MQTDRAWNASVAKQDTDPGFTLHAWMGTSCSSWRPPPVGKSPGSLCFAKGLGGPSQRLEGKMLRWVFRAWLWRAVARDVQRWHLRSGCEDSCFAKLGVCGKRLLLLLGLQIGTGSFLFLFFPLTLRGPLCQEVLFGRNTFDVFTFLWRMEIVSHRPVSPLLLRSLQAQWNYVSPCYCSSRLCNHWGAWSITAGLHWQTRYGIFACDWHA